MASFTSAVIPGVLGSPRTAESTPPTCSNQAFPFCTLEARALRAEQHPFGGSGSQVNLDAGAALALAPGLPQSPCIHNTAASFLPRAHSINYAPHLDQERAVFLQPLCLSSFLWALGHGGKSITGEELKPCVHTDPEPAIPEETRRPSWRAYLETLAL